jgi:molecular chaperone DnaK (HSP70)
MRIAGIDLGTTNSSLAAFDSDSGKVQPLEIEQISGPGLKVKATTLPSFFYIPHQSDGDISAFKMFQESDDLQGVVGNFAKMRGSQAPDRLVSSAKSWLCHSNINRSERFLPWKSTAVEKKFSPVEVSAQYLSHLKTVFLTQAGGVGAENVSWVVTVPASFDEVARQLTVAAADLVGIKNLTLLEEPLAAFYAWVGDHADYPKHIEPGDQILVCDVGGGTTDFTLIGVGEEAGKLQLTRISVGDHLLLGGDNMDLALAVRARSELEASGKSLDHWQFMALIAQVREAKERLLDAENTLEELQVSIASRGSSLFASSLSVMVRRADVEALIVNGFFPQVNFNDPVIKGRASGLHEVGLNYESEPAITRHLINFLRNSALTLKAAKDPKELKLTGVLFNGGVFKSNALRDRMIDVLKTCSNNPSLKVLSNPDLELAVAKGAAYYGYLKESGKGVRVRAGVPRSFYIGIDSNMPAIPGYTPPVMGLCVVPQGTEEGTNLAIEDRRFSLVVGQPVRFRFFSTNTRSSDQLGQMVQNAERDLSESDPLVSLMALEGRKSGDLVTVNIQAAVTETGTLILQLKDVSSPASWKLEFNVRTND